MGYKSPYDKVGKVMPEMKNQSKSSLMMKDATTPLYETGMTVEQRKKLEAMAEQASQKLEKAATRGKEIFGQTKEKTVITAPKQRKLDIDPYEQTYRESGEAATGKQFGYLSSRPGDVQATSEERISAGFGAAARENITTQRRQFQEMFGKGVQPERPFLDPDIKKASTYDQSAKARLEKSYTGRAKDYKATMEAAQKESKQRFESNVLAEKTRQELEKKPITVTTYGLADPSTYVKPSPPTKTQPKKPKQQVLTTYRSKAGKALGDVFGPKKNKRGQIIDRRAGSRASLF